MPSPLEIKLQENFEKRKREELLASLPGELKNILSPLEYQFSADIYGKLTDSPFAQFSRKTIENKKNFRLYSYQEFDDPAHILSQLQYSHFAPSPALLLQIGEGPFFCLDTDNVVPLISALFKHNPERSYVVFTDDLNAGLIIDNYIGYLDDSRRTNNAEIIYEITLWIV